MTVGTMAKPRHMEAFRKRQEERPDEVPTDIERRNEASRRRNTGQKQDDGPAGETGVPDEVRSVISSPGRSMDESVQREMESKMGGNFGDVQLHTGPTAASAADAINARAFTIGNHVAFNSGEYQSDSPEGKKVLAHELTHVRQQTEGAVSLLPKAGAEHPSPHDLTGAGVHIQPKLRISSPDDPAEQEAERVAEAVMEMDGSSEQADRDDETAPRRQPETPVSLSESVSSSSGSGNVSGDTESLVRSGVQGGGKPLPGATRSEFESRMGADFSDVRMHTGTKADEGARSIGAEAYTMGSDIAFADGKYNPESTSGQTLLAHELTHVMQQGGAAKSRSPSHGSSSKEGESGKDQGHDQESGSEITSAEPSVTNSASASVIHRSITATLASIGGAILSSKAANAAAVAGVSIAATSAMANETGGGRVTSTRIEGQPQGGGLGVNLLAATDEDLLLQEAFKYRYINKMSKYVVQRAKSEEEMTEEDLEQVIGTHEDMVKREVKSSLAKDIKAGRNQGAKKGPYWWADSGTWGFGEVSDEWGTVGAVEFSDAMVINTVFVETLDKEAITLAEAGLILHEDIGGMNEKFNALDSVFFKEHKDMKVNTGDSLEISIIGTQLQLQNDQSSVLVKSKWKWDGGTTFLDWNVYASPGESEFHATTENREGSPDDWGLW
jgi:hypothetical protein